MDNIKMAIVGAGTMGGELAYVCTAAGIPVVLKDIDRKFLDAGMERCRQVYAFRVKRRRMTQEDMDAKLNLITTALDYAGFDDVDIVIEAVPEVLEVKQKVFAEIETACPERTVLASNTSALSIGAIGALTKRPENVVGMHFFNPASMMTLIEIIKSDKTSDATVKIAINVAEKIGKIPVACADSAGFIVNRLLCAAMYEAIRCEAEGLADRRDIDSFLVKPDAGLPIGLFRMADQLGVDLLYKVMKILQGGFGERFAVPAPIQALMDSGSLGVKTGKGFYDHSDPANMKPTGSVENKELIIARVLTAVTVEARRLVAEGVATSDAVDSAMRNGALFKKPPFAYTEEAGGEAAMDARIKEYGEKYKGVFS